MARPTVRVPTTPFFNGKRGEDPKRIIDDYAQRNSLEVKSFPSDMPIYYSLLIESDWKMFTSSSGGWSFNTALDPKKAYRLPLPSHIIDGHEVQYDHNYSWITAGANVLNAFGGNNPGGAIGGIAQGVMGSLGYAMNNLKFVTLSSPNFRNYAFEWKMAPKDKKESEEIREIYLGIKMGMHPRNKTLRTILEFPRIYWIGFMPNPGYLVKFKPAVITSCSLDYQGGNPQPAFYKNADPSQSAPESIVMRLTFLELEYWLDEDFKNAKSNDPFDSSSWYKFKNP